LSEGRVREKSHDKKYGRRRSIEGWDSRRRGEETKRKRRRKSPKPSL
jgi:hypothetical protein